MDGFEISKPGKDIVLNKPAEKDEDSFLLLAESFENGEISLLDLSKFAPGMAGPKNLNKIPDLLRRNSEHIPTTEEEEIISEQIETNFVSGLVNVTLDYLQRPESVEVEKLELLATLANAFRFVEKDKSSNTLAVAVTLIEKDTRKLPDILSGKIPIYELDFLISRIESIKQHLENNDLLSDTLGFSEVRLGGSPDINFARAVLDFILNPQRLEEGVNNLEDPFLTDEINNFIKGVYSIQEIKEYELPVEPENVTYQRADKAMNYVNKYLETQVSHPTSETALNLHIYNFLKQHEEEFRTDPKYRDYPEVIDDKVLGELKRFGRVLLDELVYADNSNIPSVGVEVEVPYDVFPMDEPQYRALVENLGDMGVEVEREVTDNKPTELKLPPTTSARTQNRMLLELRKMGLIPLQGRFASLHISLGISEGMVNRYIDKQAVTYVSDLLTYAFIPAGRVRSRGYSEKSVFIGKTGGREVKNSLDWENMITRIEFRTGRIVGPNTYRLINETQLLGCMLLSKNIRFEVLRKHFKEDFEALLQKYSLTPNLSQTDKEQAAQAIELAYNQKSQHRKSGRVNSWEECDNLIDASRYLMTEYALKVREVLSREQALIASGASTGQYSL